MFVSEWKILEEDLGLNFIEVLEGGNSELLNRPLNWLNVVELMGEYGMRGPDAMILTLFEKSEFPILITNDKDFEYYFSDVMNQAPGKAVFIL